MKAYAIGSVQMRDDSWVKDYAAKTEAIVARHGGRYLVRGATMEKLDDRTAAPRDGRDRVSVHGPRPRVALRPGIRPAHQTATGRLRY